MSYFNNKKIKIVPSPSPSKNNSLTGDKENKEDSIKKSVHYNQENKINIDNVVNVNVNVKQTEIDIKNNTTTNDVNNTNITNPNVTNTTFTTFTTTVSTVPLCKFDSKTQFMEFNIEEDATIKRLRPLPKKKETKIQLEESGEEDCNSNNSNKNNNDDKNNNISDGSQGEYNDNSEEDIREINTKCEYEDDENEDIVLTKIPSDYNEQNDPELNIEKESSEDVIQIKKNLEKECAIERINIELNKKSIISLIGITKFNEIYNFYRNHIDVSIIYCRLYIYKFQNENNMNDEDIGKVMIYLNDNAPKDNKEKVNQKQ